MKGLIITIDNFPHQGGKSTHISSLIAGLKQANVDCEIFSGNKISKFENNILKLIIYCIKFFSKKRYMFYRKKIEVYLFKKELIKYIRNKKFDFVSFQDAISCGTCGFLFNNCFLTMHTYFGIEYTLDNSIFHEDDKLYKQLLNIEENSLKYAKAVICVDDRIKDHVNKIKNKKFNKIPVYTICNFTNTTIFKPVRKKKNKKNIVIGCVRRLVEKNGVIYAVMAMNYLKKYDVLLKIYGDGPCLYSIKEYIKSNKLEDKVLLLGGVDNSEMPKIYSDIDIVVVPSITKNGLQEATSISAIESMSCGIPTIASNIGGLPLLIENNVNGFLVSEQSPVEISEKIELLINNEEIYNRISVESRNYIVKNNSHINAAKEYLKIFRKN